MFYNLKAGQWFNGTVNSLLFASFILLIDVIKEFNIFTKYLHIWRCFIVSISLQSMKIMKYEGHKKNT